MPVTPVTWWDNRGYAMAALLVALSVMGILLSVALPVWRTAVQREREAELIFRGEQYAHGIALFSRRTGGFPTSLNALRDGRYIRKLYKDPITNGDFQPVYLGQVATPTPGLPAQGGRAVPGVRGQPAGFRGTPAVARGRAGLTPVAGRFGQPPPSTRRTAWRSRAARCVRWGAHYRRREYEHGRGAAFV
jgi:type II secretory pathway pseudopilin PulG